MLLSKHRNQLTEEKNRLFHVAFTLEDEMKSWLVDPSMKAGFFISLYSFKQNGQPTGLLKYRLPFLTASCDDPKTPRRILFSGSGKNGHPCL
jgi:hypothetical protein